VSGFRYQELGIRSQECWKSDMSEYVVKYQEIINTYIEALAEADKHRKPGSGILGIGPGPGDDPCHVVMDEQVAAMTAEIAENETDPAVIGELVKAVLQAEKDRKWPEAARWAVLATQRHTIPLISRISKSDREEILEWFEKTYPKRRQVPIQRQIISALKASETGR